MIESEGAEQTVALTDAALSPARSAVRSRVAAWLIHILLLLVLAVGATWGVIWWQERPLGQAELALSAGRHKRALALSNYYLASHREDSRALAVKGRALVELGRADEAAKVYEQWGAATVEDLHAWAKAYLLQEQWSRAQPVLGQVLLRQPNDPDALHELTTCRIRLGLLEEALPVAQQLTGLPGQEARGYIMQAAIYNDLGNYNKSAEMYREALARSPDAQDLPLPPDEIFLQYGSVLINSGHASDAVAILRRSVALRPTANANIGLGNALSQLGQQKAAVQAWRDALAVEPNSRAARESLAKAALEDRDFAAAREWLAPIEKSADVRSTTAYLFQRVLTLAGETEAGSAWAKRAEELRKREQTETIIEGLLLRSPKSFWANVVRAHQFARVGNWKQAEDMLKELAEQAPNEAFVKKLSSAVQARGELPSLEELPIKKY